MQETDSRVCTLKTFLSGSIIVLTTKLSLMQPCIVSYIIESYGFKQWKLDLTT